MTKRRTHSSIDKLPAGLRDALTAMLIDNIWPDDFPLPHEGKPCYEDLVIYCEHNGYKVSESAVGRFGMQMRTLARMKQAGLITRKIMADLNDEKASATQKAVAEMITAVAIEFVSDHDKLDAREIRDVARAIKDCTAIAINADKYIREQLTKKVQIAAASTRKKLTRAGVDRKIIQEIIDEHLGVVKS